MQVLVTGWFSFENMGTTAGDLMCMDIVCDWLNNASIPYQVAVIGDYHHNRRVDWNVIEPSDYSDIIFVCGPFGNGWPVTELLERFSHCRLTGINLSLLQSLEEWNPFSLLFARDHEHGSFADLSFASKQKKVPVVGLILSQKQKEYGSRALHDSIHPIIEEFIESTEMSVVHIDTRLPQNTGGLRSAREVESLIAAMDVVITTRLHGTVLALKNSVPAVAIDPISGGAKITAQARAIEWKALLQADELSLKRIQDTFTYCISDQAKIAARISAKMARKIIRERETEFNNAFASYASTQNKTY